MATHPIELLEKKLAKISSLEKVSVKILLAILIGALATRGIVPLYGYNYKIVVACLAFSGFFLNIVLDTICFRLVKTYNKYLAQKPDFLNDSLKYFPMRFILAFLWGVLGLFFLLT